MEKVSNYYDEACKLHGNVGWQAGCWSSWEHQHTVFSSVTSIVDGNGSILDVGCGQGDLYNFLHLKFGGAVTCKYTGLDISEQMIEHAVAGGRPSYKSAELSWVLCDVLDYDVPHDFVLGGGTFGLRIGDDDQQYEYIRNSLKKMYSLANRAVAVTLLSDRLKPEIDADCPQFQETKQALEELFACNPNRILEICLDITPNVIIDHTTLISQFAVYLYK